MTDVEVRVLRSMREIPREEWDALALSDPSPFVEWTWLDAMEQNGCVGGDTGWVPLHLTVRRGSRLLAAAPAYAKTNSEGEFVFDWSWADLASRLGVAYYPKLVVGVPFTPATGGRALVAPGEDRETMVHVLATAARKITKGFGGSGVHVLFPPEDEAALWESAGLFVRLGFQFHWRNDGYATPDDFLARFNAKKRHQLKREMAQPAKDGVRIETLAPDALAPSVVDTMYDLYTATVDKYFYGRRYLTKAFFDDVATRYAHRLAWVVARREGRILAGAFNVKKGPRLYGRYWGAFEELPFLHFNVCYYHGVRQCIAEGLELFEPGAGGEHKYVRGFLPAVTYSAHALEHPRLRALLSDFARREADAVREHVQHEREQGPFKAPVLVTES